MMPEMDGLEVLEAIRSNPETEKLPVIMLTSLSEMEYHNSADAKIFKILQIIDFNSLACKSLKP